MRLVLFVALTLIVPVPIPAEEPMTEAHFLGLRTMIQVVPDLAEARAWYSQAIGIDPYFDEPFYVGFDVGGYELGLLPQEEGEPTGAGGTRVYWGVQDIHREYARLLELGAREHAAPHDVGSDILVGTLYDPFGNLLGVIYNPHFAPEQGTP